MCYQDGIELSSCQHPNAEHYHSVFHQFQSLIHLAYRCKHKNSILVDFRNYLQVLLILTLQKNVLEDLHTDIFYTSLSLHEPCVSSGFVFTSDQICSQESLVIRSMMVGMNFSHGFGLYSCVFGMYPSVQWFPRLYTNVPIFWNIDTAWKHYGNQCSNPSNSSMLHDSATEPMF